MFSRILQKIKSGYKDIPNKKQYVEFFTALLTIPVLLTVICANITGLKSKNATPTPLQQQIVVTTQAVDKDKPDPTNPPTQSVPTSNVCDRGLPEIGITNPTEQEVVSDNPVIIDISIKREKYCAIAWSYRLNGGRWSDYDDNSIALYSVPDGKVTFELRVKNLASGTEKTLKRIFTYTGSQPTPTIQVSPTTQ